MQQCKGKRKKETLDPGKRIGSEREGIGNHKQELNTGRETHVNKGLVMQQQVKKGTKNDATLSRQGIKPIDRYVAAEASSNQERVQGARRKQIGAQKAIISPANPRQKANKRARRRHLQLHRTQAQPTLT